MAARRRWPTVLVAVLAAAGCAQLTAVQGPLGTGPTAPGAAVSALAQLPVRGRAPKTGFSRTAFGQSWKDIDRNGCDQRNDVLARDLDGTAFKPGTRDCVVLTGILTDPYTGRPVLFVRGPRISDDVQIDHVVALSDAWQTGAQQLDPATRERLANDPLNLVATAGPVNQAKGDSDAASWLPPHRPARCAFVARQVAVKSAYRLWVTAAEHDAIAGILAGCPTQPLPSGSSRLGGSP